MMTQEQFNQIVELRIEKTKELLKHKGLEYVRNNDKLHNFRTASRMNKEPMIVLLHGMLTKHLVLYLDIISDIKQGKKISEETINEKIGDIITYFHLAECVLKESIILTNKIEIHDSPH